MNDDELQFDRAVAARPAADGGLTCRACQRPISSAYYDVSGQTMCVGCHGRIQAFRETPRGAGPLLKAGLFGLGAGIAGAIVYYAVIAITNFEIGIVAILIGYMVGYAVRKGAGGRGGRRFQVLAIALTYLAVAFAYAPIAVKGARKDRAESHASASAEDAAAAAKPAKSAASLVTALAVLVGLILALPVLVIVGSMPSGLISAAIIFF